MEVRNGVEWRVIVRNSVEWCHVPRNGVGWCGMTHGRAVWYKPVRDGIMCNGAESRDMELVTGAVAAWCRIVRDGARKCRWLRGGAWQFQTSTSHLKNA